MDWKGFIDSETNSKGGSELTMKGMNFRIFVLVFVVYGFLTSVLSVAQNLVLPNEAKILLDKIEQATKGKIVEINYIKDVFW
jgi:hypothetical protein